MDLNSYLEHEQIFTTSPYDQENLLEKKKMAIEAREVVFDNYYRTEKEKIYCHICGSHRHNNGYTGLLKNGKRILFGSQCAKEYFGPEIEKRCVGEIRQREHRATERYRILCIKNSVEPVENWLETFGHLFPHIDNAWRSITIKHSKSFTEIMKNLHKNGGRLVQNNYHRTGGNAVREVGYITPEILTHIQNSDAIPLLGKAQQNITFVSSFIEAIREFDTEPGKQVFENVARSYQNALDAAKNADLILAFTADFFNPQKLAKISKWWELKRRQDLQGKLIISDVDITKLFTKKMGSGIETPTEKLSDILKTTRIAEHSNSIAAT